MAGWIASVDNSTPGAGPTVHVDNLRRTMGGGTVHVRAQTEQGAKVIAAQMLNCSPAQVTVTQYSTGAWSEASGGDTS